MNKFGGGSQRTFGFGMQPWRMPMFNPQPFGMMMPASLPGQMSQQTMPGMQQPAAPTQPISTGTPSPAPQAAAPTTQQPWLAPGQQPANPVSSSAPKSLTFDPATYGYYDMSGKWYSPDDARTFMAG